MRNWQIKLEYKKVMMIILGWILAYFLIKKQDLLRTINQALPFQEANLLAGMVWGEKSGMKGEFYNQLVKTGLIHIVVVSGANLMIVGKSLIENLAKFIGRKTAIIGGGGMILIYVNLVGWQIPVVRALLFLGVYYVAQILGRKFRSGRALFLVVLMMFLADFEVYKEVSFWLSILAFGAVIINQKKGIWGTTFWVNIFILPILSLTFGQISLISPLTNMAVLFLVEIVSVLGFWGSILGIMWLNLGKIILSLSYPMLRYLIEIVEIGSKWQWATINFKFNWEMLLGWYLILGAYWYEKKKV
jgi:competence protein ComEC